MTRIEYHWDVVNLLDDKLNLRFVHQKPVISRKFFNFIEDGSPTKSAGGEDPSLNSSLSIFDLQGSQLIGELIKALQ